MKIYTRTGDDGTTGTFGGGRVQKDDARVEAYGAVDEANSALGLARALSEGAHRDVDDLLERVQNALFDLGADLACPLDSGARAHLNPLAQRDVEYLERAVDRFDAELEPLRTFILPGGNPAGAGLHLARAVARRAERAAVTLAELEAINPWALAYLNRLSDLLFTLARVVNLRSGDGESAWSKRGDES